MSDALLAVLGRLLFLLVSYPQQVFLLFFQFPFALLTIRIKPDFLVFQEVDFVFEKCPVFFNFVDQALVLFL